MRTTPTSSPPPRAARKVLFTTAPYGRFFRELAIYGAQADLRFDRIAFDAGDFFEAPKGHAQLFRGRPADWDAFIEAALRDGGYDLLIVWNDAMWFNERAIAAADKLGIPYLTLENGYLRPFWVTLEQGGVNGRSKLLSGSGTPYLTFPHEVGEDFPNRIRWHVRATIIHYCYAILLAPFFPYIPNLYGVSDWDKGLLFAREFLRPQRQDEITGAAAWTAARTRKRFLCLTQKPGDTQLEVHSDVHSNNDLLDQVIPSFARYAPPDSVLMVKKHPFDFGIENTPDHFDNLVGKHDLKDRCFLVSKALTYELMASADAVIVNNSSTGFDALRNGKPVRALGRAIWRRPGMTDEQPLDDFWTSPQPPDSTQVAAFVDMLKQTSQINGGFYSDLSRSILFPRLADRIHAFLDHVGADKAEMTCA